MKKIIVLLTIVSLSTFAVAQESNSFQIGAKAGVNFATITGDDFAEISEDRNSKIGFYAGLVAETFLADQFALQGELLYSTQGVKFNRLLSEEDGELQVDYIQVPVLAKIYLIEGLNIHAGPQFGFKINEEIDFNPNEEGGNFDSDSIKDFDLQLALGAEFKISNFLIQARYAYGFSEMIENVNAHNSVLSAGIGFMF